jgi:hypothetical protein
MVEVVAVLLVGVLVVQLLLEQVVRVHRVVMVALLGEVVLVQQVVEVAVQALMVVLQVKPKAVMVVRELLIHIQVHL